ncbi:MBL fold metallo-hydrolase [Sphingomonas sp.]|uniref:MBL fold metallo-hydrolase n=1 Tax=Sphingomonas sp. TaxID=28214 RepID=UPI00286E25C0|nr:MBL fold metallo-hydrolase [Sphingomonas sp.]
MKVRILGCGTSTGVPKIGNDWGKCDSDEPRNRRLRSSILVESAGERLLVDCGPDLRAQLLGADVGRVDGVLITHDHADHCHGIDDLRPLAQALGGRLPVYAREGVLAGLRARFEYAFVQAGMYPPVVEPVALGEELRVGGATVRFVDQPHGNITSLGLRFEEGGFSLVYAIDFNDMTPDMAALYQGADVMIADCLTRQPHPTHAHLDGVLGWARDLKVGRLYLTHMGTGLDYAALVAELPEWAAPAHDGLEICSP